MSDTGVLSVGVQENKYVSLAAWNVSVKSAASNEPRKFSCTASPTGSLMETSSTTSSPTVALMALTTAITGFWLSEKMQSNYPCKKFIDVGLMICVTQKS